MLFPNRGVAVLLLSCLTVKWRTCKCLTGLEQTTLPLWGSHAIHEDTLLSNFKWIVLIMNNGIQINLLRCSDFLVALLVAWQLSMFSGNVSAGELNPDRAAQSRYKRNVAQQFFSLFSRQTRAASRERIRLFWAVTWAEFIWVQTHKPNPFPNRHNKKAKTLTSSPESPPAVSCALASCWWDGCPAPAATVAWTRAAAWWNPVLASSSRVCSSGPPANWQTARVQIVINFVPTK